MAAATASSPLPWGITVGADGCVYVADWGNDRVPEVRRRRDAPGILWDVGARRRRVPPGRAAAWRWTPNGYIYVADWGNERVQVLDADGGFVQKLRGEATLSAWAANFLAINVEEGDARSRANLEPEIEYFVDDPHEESSHIEKYFLVARVGQAGPGTATCT